MAVRAPLLHAPGDADICLVVEGCYPYVSGGVANWVDWLLRSLPDRSFAVVAIVADERPLSARYDFPDNVLSFDNVSLNRFHRKPLGLREPRLDAGIVADLLCRVLADGDLEAFAELDEALNRPSPIRQVRFGRGVDEAPSLEQLTSAGSHGTSCRKSTTASRRPHPFLIFSGHGAPWSAGFFRC